MDKPLRIAMWSGPRNLSTALMRSFSQRSDCAVIDEPFYAAYLDKTGLDHPMRDEVLKGERDAQVVARSLVGPVPDGKAVFYQKHMLQHIIDGMPTDWIKTVTNVFLIRDPARVIASFEAKWERCTAQDLGLAQQRDFFEASRSPIVVDADDILADPKGLLVLLCEALGVGFEEAMLSWPAGPHKNDGVWGAHWYGQIWNSTGFAPADNRSQSKTANPELLEQAMDIYQDMRKLRLHQNERRQNGA